VEARANDGTIEAVRPEFAKNFALAVQWHPEWRFAENRISQALFSAFGKAVMAVTSLEQR
jgi:putative glutamine amidotransferase